MPEAVVEEGVEVVQLKEGEGLLSRGLGSRRINCETSTDPEVLYNDIIAYITTIIDPDGDNDVGTAYEKLERIILDDNCKNKLNVNIKDGTNFTYFDKLSNLCITLYEFVYSTENEYTEELNKLVVEINATKANTAALLSVSNVDEPTVTFQKEQNDKEITDLEAKIEKLQANLKTTKEQKQLLTKITIATQPSIDKRIIQENLPELSFNYKKGTEEELNFTEFFNDSSIKLSIQEFMPIAIDILGIQPHSHFLSQVQKCLKIDMSDEIIKQLQVGGNQKIDKFVSFFSTLYESTTDEKKLLLLPLDDNNNFRSVSVSNKSLLQILNPTIKPDTEHRFKLTEHDADFNEENSSVVTSKVVFNPKIGVERNKNIIVVYIKNDGIYMLGYDLSHSLSMAEHVNYLTEQINANTSILDQKTQMAAQNAENVARQIINRTTLNKLKQQIEQKRKDEEERNKESKIIYERKLTILKEQSKTTRDAQEISQQNEDAILEAKRLEKKNELTDKLQTKLTDELKIKLKEIEKEYKTTLAQISTNKQTQEDLILEGELLKQEQIHKINHNTEILKAEIEVQNTLKALQTDQKEESDETLKQQQIQSKQTITQIKASNAAVAQQKEDYEALKQALIASTKQIEGNTTKMTELYNDVNINAVDLKQNIESLLSDIKAGKAEYDAALKNLQTHIVAQKKELGSESGLEQARKRASAPPEPAATAAANAGGARKGKSRKHLRKQSKKTKKRKASSKKTKRKKSKTTTKKRKKTKRKNRK